VSLARKVSAIRPPAKLDPRAGCSKLHRTATAFGHATVGTCIHQSESLMGAARPSAGRSPVAAHNAKCGSPRACQSRTGSGTLRLMKPQVNWQSDTKVSRLSCISVWLGHERKSSNSTTPPNPSIEGMPKRLRLLCTPHVKR
jgi:hypothetical protein